MQLSVEQNLESLVRKKIIILEKIIAKRNAPDISNIDDRVREEVEILKMEKELNKIVKQINDFLISE